MFCPEGFVTLKAIIESALADNSLAMNRGYDGKTDNIIVGTFDADLGDLAQWLAKYHTRHDIVEQIVFEKSYEAGLFLCSHSGTILHLEMPFHLVRESVFTIVRALNVYSDNETVEDFFVNTKLEDLAELYSTYVEASSIEKSESEGQLEHESVKAWANLWYRFNSNVNFYHHRGSYTVNTAIFDALKNNPNFFWDGFGDGLGDVQDVLRNLNGSALCIKAEHAALLTPEKINTKFGERIFSFMVGEDEIAEKGNPFDQEDLDETQYENTVGRPNKSIRAAALVSEEFPNGSYSSLKEAVRYLEHEHNIRVHTRTLQRGLKKIQGDK